MTTDEVFGGPGEMRARCRAFDWAATALGPAERWSPALQTAVALCLDSALPTCVYAGPEFLLIYNDLWRPWLGTRKHPGALGRPAREVWAEVWPVVGNELAEVFAGGAPISRENQRFVLDREDAPEETFFTYALSPVRGAGGAVVAVHNVCLETSGRVRAERALSRLIAASPAVMAIYSGPDHVVTYVNATWERLVGKPGALGRPFRDVFPEMAATGILERLDHVYATGERYAVEELELPIQRRPGAPVEDSFWSFVWEPATLPDAPDAESGGAAGEDAAPEPTASGLGRDILCHAIDVTAQVLARREVERLLDESERERVATAAARAALATIEARQRFLLTLDDALRPLASAEEVQYEAARLLGQQLGAIRVGYAEVLPDDVHTVVARHYTDGVGSVEGRYRVDQFGPKLLPALQAGRTTVRSDIARDPSLTDAERAIYASLGLGATVNVPLVKGGRLAAVLFMHHPVARTWAPDELALLEAVAERTWGAVERARAEAALVESETRYRMAVEAAEIGTWSWDLSSDRTAFDPRVRETFGIASDEPAPRVEVLANRVHPDDRERVAAALGAASDPAGDGRYAAEYRVLHPDGSERWAAVAGLMRFAGEGPERRPVALLGTAMDITPRKRAEGDRARLLAEAEAARLAAETARAEAEAANQTKSQFLATMSHELRTPLNAIGGYAQLMELGLHGPVTPDQVTALGRIQRGQQHLLGLINSVLNYAKLEAGHVQYQTVDVPVAEALAEVSALIAPQARTKGLTVVTSTCATSPDGSPLVARADPETVRQVLLNLLSNAVKFTRGGGTVTVGCDCAPGADHDDWRVALTVADTGRGIAADQLRRVFAPFVQVDQRLTRAEEGTGLGLAISHDLARGMGGDLTVESTPSVGSTFTLTLPRGPARPKSS